jgi:hypothetical protein
MTDKFTNEYAEKLARLIAYNVAKLAKDRAADIVQVGWVCLGIGFLIEHLYVDGPAPTLDYIRETIRLRINADGFDWDRISTILETDEALAKEFDHANKTT